MFGPVSLMLFLRLQVSLVGVLKILAGAFVPGQAVFFSMVLGSGFMGVGGKVTVLSGYLLRFVHNNLKCTRVAVRGARESRSELSTGVQDVPGGCRFHGESRSGHAHYATTRPQSARSECRTESATARLFPAPGYVAASIARLVALEVRAIDALGLLGFLAAFWRWAIIAVLRMETVVHVALEFVGAMKPRASANEGFATKPFRTVVAGRSTVIRSDVIVTVRAIRSHADDDVDLSLCFGSGSRDATVRALPRPRAICAVVSIPSGRLRTSSGQALLA